MLSTYVKLTIQGHISLIPIINCVTSYTELMAVWSLLVKILWTKLAHLDSCKYENMYKKVVLHGQNGFEVLNSISNKDGFI